MDSIYTQAKSILLVAPIAVMAAVARADPAALATSPSGTFRAVQISDAALFPESTLRVHHATEPHLEFVSPLKSFFQQWAVTDSGCAAGFSYGAGVPSSSVLVLRTVSIDGSESEVRIARKPDPTPDVVVCPIPYMIVVSNTTKRLSVLAIDSSPRIEDIANTPKRVEIHTVLIVKEYLSERASRIDLAKSVTIEDCRLVLAAAEVADGSAVLMVSWLRELVGRRQDIIGGARVTLVDRSGSLLLRRDCPRAFAGLNIDQAAEWLWGIDSPIKLGDAGMSLTFPNSPAQHFQFHAPADDPDTLRVEIVSPPPAPLSDLCRVAPRPIRTPYSNACVPLR